MPEPSEPATWYGSLHARRCVTVLTVALVIAFTWGRPMVLAIAAPAAVFLVRAAAPRRPDFDISSTLGSQAVVEGDEVSLSVHAGVGLRCDVLHAALRPQRGFRLSNDWQAVVGSADVSLSTTITALHWGRVAVGEVIVTAYSEGGLWEAQCRVPLPELLVAPRPAAMSSLALRPLRTDRVGEHVGATVGSGVEFAGIRPYAPGDAARRISWTTSLRRRQVVVRETAGEYAADVVVAVDLSPDVGPEGASSADLAARGATGLATLLLATGDRVGLIALGDRLRWLRPAHGQRQLHRLIDLLVDATTHSRDPDTGLGRLAAIDAPVGTRIVLFSPLVDPRATAAITHLRGSGHPVAVVDVLPSLPPPRDPRSALATRVWRLERQALIGEFLAVGVPVVAWRGDEPLDLLLAPALRGGRRRR